MISALDFLDHVLPDEGVYCGFVLAGEQRLQRFFDSREQLAEFLLAQDALGRTTYYACGVFNKHGNRKQENSRGAQDFWCEADAGPDKPYPDARAAAHAALAFARQAGLPCPLLVASGNGIHVHWPLATLLSPAVWRRYAEGLLRLCNHHNFHVDPARSRDLSSVLRVPGTFNRKHGQIKEVRCVKLEGPYSIEQFASCLDPALPALRRETQQSRTRLSGRLTAALASVYPEREADPTLIAARCRQFRRLEETQGRLPEPFWRDISGVAVFCRNGREYFHRHSQGDGRYTVESTNDRLDRWEINAGPTTCEQLAFSGGKEHCTGCPHRGRITSPIVLGYDRPDSSTGATNPSSRTIEAVGSGIVSTEKTRLENGFSATTFGNFGDSAAGFPAREEQQATRELNGHHFELPGLPTDYIWSGISLAFMKSDGKQNIADIICTYPIYLNGVQKGEAKGLVHYAFKQWKPHDGWSTFTISAAEMHSARMSGALAERGANIADNKAFSRYVTVAVDAYHERAKMDNMYEQMGWKHNDTCFLLGDVLYTPEGKRNVEVSDELRLRGRDLGPREGGSLAEWKHASHALFATGCEAQSFMVLCGFGAALIRFLDSTEGGALIAGTATETGGGKSTSAIGATSIYGKKIALSIEKSFSTVTRGLTFATLGNVVCIHDELRARDPNVLRDFIIDYTGGTDKTRTSRSGELKHAMGTWQSLLLTCDNYSLLDAVSGHADTADEAPAMRVIEIPINVPSHLRKLYKDEIRDVMEKNSGFAADVFLTFITKPENLIKVKALLKKMYMELYALTGWEHKHRFWVRTLACAAVGGIIARQLGLIECSVDRIIRWVIGILQQRIEPGKRLWQVGALGHYLNSKLGERLTVDKEWEHNKRNVVLIEPRRGELSIRHEQNNNRYLISTYSLREYCIKHGFNYNELLSYLMENRIVTGKSRQILGAGTQYAGGQVWVLIVDGNHPLLTGLPQEVWSKTHAHRSPGPDVVALHRQSTGSIPPSD